MGRCVAIAPSEELAPLIILLRRIARDCAIQRVISGVVFGKAW